jgi:hypothetical protein
MKQRRVGARCPASGKRRTPGRERRERQEEADAGSPSWPSARGRHRNVKTAEARRPGWVAGGLRREETGTRWRRVGRQDWGRENERGSASQGRGLGKRMSKGASSVSTGIGFTSCDLQPSRLELPNGFIGLQVALSWSGPRLALLDLGFTGWTRLSGPSGLLLDEKQIRFKAFRIIQIP